MRTSFRGFGLWLTSQLMKHAAIDVDGLAGDVSGVFGGEEEQQVRHVVVGAGAAERNLGNPFGHEFTGRIAAKQSAPFAVVVGPHVGSDDAGGVRVDRDAIGREFLGQALGESHHAELAGGVVRCVDEALPRLPGGGVQDPAAVALLAHHRGGCLAAEEGSGRVHGEHLVPVRDGEVLRPADRDNTGVVDQDVELGHRKGRLRPGYDADILAVDGDPLSDPAALHAIRAVYVRGTALTR